MRLKTPTNQPAPLSQYLFLCKTNKNRQTYLQVNYFNNTSINWCLSNFKSIQPFLFHRTKVLLELIATRYFDYVDYFDYVFGW